MALLTFKGGIHPDDGKNLAKDKAIVEVPLEFNLTSGGSELTTRAEQEKPDKPNIRPIHVDKVDVYLSLIHI